MSAVSRTALVGLVCVVTVCLAATDSSLVAWYPLTASLVDSTSNGGDGVGDGITFAARPCSAFPGAAQFDGSHDFSVPASVFTNISANDVVTITAWVFPTSLSPVGAGIFPITECSDFTLSFFFTSTTINVIMVYGGDAHFVTNVPLNVWSHLAVTFDHGAISFYSNGALLGTTTSAKSDIGAPSAPVHVGGAPAGTMEYAVGKISDLRIYSVVKSASDISEISRMCSAGSGGNSPTTLVAHYPLINSAEDASGFNNHGTATGVTYAEGPCKGGSNAAVFSGNDEVAVPIGKELRAIENADVVTVAAWAFVTSWKTSNAASETFPIFESGDWNWMFYLTSTTINFVPTLMGDTYCKINGGLSLNKWYHVAMVFDGPHSKIQFYLDGVSVCDVNLNKNDLAKSSSQYLHIGNGLSGGHEWAHGKISDVRIHNVTLNAYQIASLCSCTRNTAPSPPSGSLSTGGITGIVIAAIVAVVIVVVAGVFFAKKRSAARSTSVASTSATTVTPPHEVKTLETDSTNVMKTSDVELNKITN